MINVWLREFTKKESNDSIGILNTTSNDFQHQNRIIIVNYTPKGGDLHKSINFQNLLKISVYYFVRKGVEANWLNDRDQFLYPNNRWEKDKEFQNDCLAYTLFNNNIQSKYGTNHWIPFTEQEVSSREKFESNFMSRFLKGKIKPKDDGPNIFSILLEPKVHYEIPLHFSNEAKVVFDAGRELWKYYHQQPSCNVNASLYDIREHFQGRNEQGKMNNKSEDETYMKLIGNLREKLRELAEKTEPKVYEYGFLKE